MSCSIGREDHQQSRGSYRLTRSTRPVLSVPTLITQALVTANWVETHPCCTVPLVWPVPLSGGPELRSTRAVHRTCGSLDESRVRAAAAPVAKAEGGPPLRHSRQCGFFLDSKYTNS